MKKFGRIPDGGGRKVLGRQAGRATRSGMGFDSIHSAVEDHSRVAYSEIHPDEKADACAAFLRRAVTFFAASGIDRIERVLTDNAWTYRRSFAWPWALADLGAAGKLTRAHRPQTNGKVERFNRTLLDVWSYLRPDTGNTERTAALADFLHTYNHHRCHTALGGQPPTSRSGTRAHGAAPGLGDGALAASHRGERGARAEHDPPACGDQDSFTGLRIACAARGGVDRLEPAEPGHGDGVAVQDAPDQSVQHHFQGFGGSRPRTWQSR